MILKPTLAMLTTLILFSFLLSCGGSTGNEKKIAKVKPQNVEITGDLSEYLQVVDNAYEIVDDFGGKLSIKVKAKKPMLQSELVNKDVEISASILGENNMPVSGAGEFTMFKTSKDKILSLLKKGSGEEVIELGADITQYDDVKHADKSKMFTVSSLLKESLVLSSTNSPADDNQTPISNSDDIASNDVTSTTDCDKFMKDYEAFVNSYIKIFRKYKVNPTDASIMTEYTEAVEKATQLDKDGAMCTDTKYVTKLLELQNRLAKAISL